jgi:hypothetical protein
MSDTTPPPETETTSSTDPAEGDGFVEPTTSTSAAPTSTTPPTTTPPTTTSTPSPPAESRTTVAAYGIEADLPPGWEGRISKRSQPAVAAARVAAVPGAEGVGPEGTPSERPQPIAHLANFPLPEDRGDFGSGAVDVMGQGDVLVVLFEYGPESVGQPLFSREGMPADLTPKMFSPSALQRTMPGQAGCQVFFTERGRAFCAYVVIGRHDEATRLVPQANAALRATRILPR